MKKITCLFLVLILIFSSALIINAEDTATEETSVQSDNTEEETTSKYENAEKLPEGDYYKGDINCDRIITASDARTVLKFSAKQITLTEMQCVLADVNTDFSVNAQDARLVLRISAEIDNPKLSKKAKNANNSKLLSQYNNQATYQSTLDGFSTNIRDKTVFEKIRKLENYCANLKNVVTFYYTDVKKQYYIQFDSTKKYRTQCTVKAPYVKGMLDYMEANNIPITRTLYLKNSQKWEGHYLSSYPAGTGFTIRELMYYTIRYSDNTAYQVLFDYFGTEVLNMNAEKIGAELRLDDYIFGEASAADMTKFFLDIYTYNGKYKEVFYEDLMNSLTAQLIGNGLPSDVPFIRKSGYGGNLTVGYHDCSIVFAEMPFVLIIYTSINFDRNFDKLPFQRIAENIYSINNSLEFI